MKITKITIASTPDDEARLKEWDSWMMKRNKNFNTVRALHTLKRVGLDLTDFKVKSTYSGNKGYTTKIRHVSSWNPTSRAKLAQVAPELIENGMDVTIMINNGRIHDILLDCGSGLSADLELIVHGVRHGSFTYWNLDEKNEHGRNVFVKYEGETGVEKAKECLTKFHVR